jgi:PAS domain S-box-containing protein
MKETISAENKLSLPVTILVALALAILGYCGNFLGIQVAFGVQFIFGSIFAILAITILGLGWGVLVAILASSYTYHLWNHPYAIIIFTLEIIWLGMAWRRGKRNILLIDSFYWLVLGIPLVVAFYLGVQHLDPQSVFLIALKQPVNGVFNAMIASIILSHTWLRKWTPRQKSTNLPTYATTLFHLIALSLMIPSLSLLFYMNYRETAFEQRRTIEELEKDAREAEKNIEVWVNNHINAVRVIAHLAEKYPLRPSAELQAELGIIRSLFPDFHNIFIADENATTLAFYPPVNERGESTIGINFSDRAYFKQLKSTLKPVVSDVFMGRGGIFSPIFSISVPVVHDQHLAAFGLGAVNLEKLRDKIALLDHKRYLSLIDRHGNIIVSSNPARKPLTPVNEKQSGSIFPISAAVSLWVPGKIKNVSIMTVWKGAYYFIRLPIGQTDWTLMAEFPLAPTQKYLYGMTIWELGGVAVLYILAMVLAHLISRRFAGTLESLSAITKDFPSKIRLQTKIDWPRTFIAETDQLIHNFMETEQALRDYLQMVQDQNGKLQREQERIRNIIYGTNVGTWEWQIQNGEITINSRWAEIIGYTRQELDPLTIDKSKDLINPEDLTVSNELLKKHFQGKSEYYEHECRVKHKDGHWRWVLDCGKVVSWTEDHKPLTMSGTRQDITERKQLEEERIVLSKLESTGILAGGLAHDFNNLLSIILGNMEMTEDTDLSGAERNGYFNEARKAIQEAKNLTKLFITLATGGDPVKKPLSITELLENQASLVMRGARVTLDRSAPEDLWVVEADEGQIGVVIRNLMLNALEAMPDGGVISVTAENIASKSPSTKLPAVGKFVRVAISDRGIGIPTEILSKVFDPYFSTKERGSQKGMGLGLSICKSIIQKHGGFIDLESEKGRGTTVSFYLPASEKPIGKKPPVKDLVSGKGRVLAMDDEESMRKMMGAVLKRLNYEVELAENGEKAIENYRAAKERGCPFTVVILDLTIRGGMGGKETLKGLMEIDPEVNAIVASGYNDDPVMKNYQEYGFKGALSKPFFINELKKVLSGIKGTA